MNTGGDIWDCKACMHLCMKQFPLLGHSAACILYLVKQLIRCFLRVVSHWCAERSGRAEPQIWKVDGRTDEESEGWIRVHSIRMQRKLFFPAFFLLAHRQSVWDLVWSASVRSLQSPSNAALMHTGGGEEGRFRVSNSWNYGNQHFVFTFTGHQRRGLVNVQ